MAMFHAASAPRPSRTTGPLALATQPERLDPQRDGWDRLLAALDPDPAEAARRYQALRRKLVDLFRWRAAAAPEDLADDTLERVAGKLGHGEVLRGGVAAYAAGVARLVALEAARRQRRTEPVEPAVLDRAPAPGEDRDGDDRRACLERCLDALPPASRDLLLQYLEGQGQARIEHRKALAAELGIELNALRIRVHRIRAQVEASLRKAAQAEATPPRPYAERSKHLPTLRHDRSGR